MNKVKNQTNKVSNALNFLAKKMPHNQDSPNPLADLTVDDINYLQAYLEKVKCEKMRNRQKPFPENQESSNDSRFSRLSSLSRSDMNFPESRPLHPTRTGKKSNVGYSFCDVCDGAYYNPYEYGAKQDSELGTLLSQRSQDPQSTQPIGSNGYPGIRNIGVESILMQKEMTKLPGQKEITERDFDRFHYLPFNPQNPDHIVWSDNMPRGGVSTREDRLEI